MEMESPRKESRWRHLRRHTPRAATAAASPVSPASAAAGAVLKQGFLLKKGHRLPTTKDRFFVLRPHLLSYFRAKRGAAGDADDAAGLADARQLRGVIELSPSDLITPIATSRHWFILQKRSGPDGKSYKLELRASSPEQRQQWIDALRSAAKDAVVVNPTLSVLQAERERQLTHMLTMLHVRDASLLSTVLRQQQASSSSAITSSASNGVTPLVSTPSVVDLRASFQVFHELVLLQSLVTQIRTSWGDPSAWSCEQYDLLVDSIALAQQRAGSSAGVSVDYESGDKPSVLSEARALQYAFEEVPTNQHKLLTRQQDVQPTRRPSALSDSFNARGGRVRCPTIYSYLSTFERLTPSDSQPRLSTDSSAKSSLNSHGESVPLSPRSTTLAKYAHLYLEEEGRNHKPWSWERDEDDDLTPKDSTSKDAAATAITLQLIGRYANDRVYSSLRHHTLLFVNPNRMLKTSKFTSIYDEQVVLVYAQTPFASTQLASHPFAMAKQALFRLFFSRGPCQSLLLSGDSGSGKTELSKELLKYVVLTAQPSNPKLIHAPKIVLYTSSTKSTLQMRHDETRTLDLLHAKGITDYAVVLLDLQPEKWTDMTSVSKSKRLPQVHIDGLFFGFYETLQRLEDEEQLRMYLRNPHVAKKLSAVLDSNILLEAFAHAATPLNGNSSRYAKSVDVQVAYGQDPSQYQVLGCVLTPFLLEKSRVTSATTQNFHVLYALVHGVNAVSGNGVIVPPHFATLAQQLHLSGCSSETFRFLDRAAAGSPSTEPSREMDWKKLKDLDRFQNILMAMETVAIDGKQQEAIFRVLSAVLWLGNLDFQPREADARSSELSFAGLSNATSTPIAKVLEELLSLDSEDTLRSLLVLRRVEMKVTGEAFDVKLSVGQAQHARDTLARSLYQMVFQYVVAQLNRATQCDAAVSVKSMRILDLFGFENFDDSHANSLEQLCINFLTEKFAAAEQQLVKASAYTAAHESPSSEAEVETLLRLFESPLGIFATLEEQTVLHQSDAVGIDLEQKKNDVLVRYLYQRNANQLVPQPSQLKQDQLRFLVPHSRAVVTYDATDFVAKNSDFQQQWALLSSLEKTKHAGIKAMVLTTMQQVQAKGDAANSGSRGTAVGSSGSLATQFRSQIHQQITLLAQETSGPLFLHCLKPSANAFVHATDSDTMKKQVIAQKLDATALLCRDNSPCELSIDTAIFQSRYRRLVATAKDFSGGDGIDALIARLDEQLHDVLDLHDDRNRTVFVVEGDIVYVRTLQAAETLELLLNKRQFEAATRIQAQARMLRAWRWYRALQSDRKALAHELLAIYGPNSTRKIERTLRKYQGREHELMEKIEAKKLEKKAIAEIAHGMESFLGQVSTSASGGFLDPQLLEYVLRDAEIRELLAKNDRIVVALREMSLNPQQMLPKQLQDPELRVFYQRMVALLQASMAQQAQEMNDEADNAETLSGGTLEERVRLLVTKHKRVWLAVAQREGEGWVAIKDKLDEISDEPEMLLFYADEDEFVEQLTTFVGAVELQVQNGGVQAAEDDVAPMTLLLAKLKLVELNATLMAAMQGDPFFVEALQSPQLVTAVHQLMTDREAVTAESSLQTPLMVEFFTRLVRLSEETRKHR